MKGDFQTLALGAGLYGGIHQSWFYFLSVSTGEGNHSCLWPGRSEHPGPEAAAQGVGWGGKRQAATLDASERAEGGHREASEGRLHSPAHTHPGRRAPQMVSRL